MASSEEMLNDISTEIKSLGTDAQKKFADISSRMLLLEQKQDSQKFTGGGNADLDSPGAKFVQSSAYKNFIENGQRSSGRVMLDLKTALVSATGLDQPLVPPFIRPGIIAAQNRRLRVRNLLPQFPVASSLIEYAKESSLTNNAAPQYSAGAYENVTKAESAMAFTLSSMGVSTLAHWLPVSNQLLSDAPALQAYINSRLLYGLAFKEEDELLNGSGIQGHLSGLITNATAYDTNYSAPATDSYIDTVGHSFTMLQVANFEPSGVILNPKDWARVQQTKTATTNAYIFGDPQQSATPQLWGVPVVLSNSITEGSFLTGDFNVAAAIWDRNDATVEVSREHSDFFIKNMSAVLCESRLALTVFRTDALILGYFPFGS